jgi:hypothetical protein
MILNAKYEYMIMYTRPKVWVAGRNMNSGTFRRVKFSYLCYVVKKIIVIPPLPSSLTACWCSF